MHRWAFAAFLLTSPAQAGDWFQHKFGELRAYHGDWLAVCDTLGAGPCRVVQTDKDSGSDAYFDQRLAVHRIDNSPDWAIEVMDRGLEAHAITQMTFTFDGDEVVIEPSAWGVGDFEMSNAVDTITITDKTIAADLVARMQAGNHVVIRYVPNGGDGKATFTLRGATAATNAIEARVLARQE